jgi:drug/metabolite transporter (DMT)-like permease
MSAGVMAAVLLGALLHAGWNALIRGSSERTLDTVLVVAGAALIAALALPFAPLPAAASWPFLLASGLIHVAYFLLVALSYRHGELSFAYPLMRGAAPVVSALAAALLLSESLPAGSWLGVLLIGGGIMLMAADSWRSGAFQGRAALAALATAAVIVVYTLVDGAGVRLSGHAAAYTGWVFVLTAIPLVAMFLCRNGAAARAHFRRCWHRGLLGGACTLGSYGLALWAMTHAPIALVAALRETSVIFGALLAVLLLGERPGRLRWAAIAIVSAGAAAIKLVQ